MEWDEYIDSRVDNQINWLSRKSAKNRTLYHSTSLIQILASATIVVLVGLDESEQWTTWTISFLSLLVVVFTSLNNILRFQEKWISYRSTSEKLKAHKFLFLTKSKPYHNKSAFLDFVENVESILAEENESWKSYIKASSDNNESL